MNRDGSIISEFYCFEYSSNQNTKHVKRDFGTLN